MARMIDADELYKFLTDQLVKETGMFSKGVNKGINIARSAVKNPDAIPTFTPSNDPLTLQQLREMDGKPVWIHTFSSKSKKTNIEEWALVASSSEYSVSFVRVAVAGRMEKKCSDYEKTWLAYPYPLPHIDREAWEPCESCNTCENCRNKDDYNPYEGMLGLCAQCYKKSEFDPFKFCKECGHPLTEEAWAELEKRIGGAV